MRSISYQRKENIPRTCQHIRGYSKTLFLDEMCALVLVKWKINNNAAVYALCVKMIDISPFIEEIEIY